MTLLHEEGRPMQDIERRDPAGRDWLGATRPMKRGPPFAHLRPFGHRPAPPDTGRLGRQGVAPPPAPCSSA